MIWPQLSLCICSRTSFIILFYNEKKYLLTGHLHLLVSNTENLQNTAQGLSVTSKFGFRFSQHHHVTNQLDVYYLFKLTVHGGWGLVMCLRDKCYWSKWILEMKPKFSRRLSSTRLLDVLSNRLEIVSSCEMSYYILFII